MKYKRSEFIPSEIVKGVAEKDLLMNSFRFYKFKRPFGKYILKQDDYMRPDKISLKVYGLQDYWWIILRCNPNIEDIWNDFISNDKVVTVMSNEIDPSIPLEQAQPVEMLEAEYLYPDSYKVGEYIYVPSILDIQELYTFSKSSSK
jgi:hypothetical protein